MAGEGSGHSPHRWCHGVGNVQNSRYPIPYGDRMNPACLVLLLLTSANPVASDDCRCVPTALNETTHWGGNRGIVVQETKSYPSMRGVVLDQSGSEMNNILVEVFDHPEGLLLPYPRNKEAERKQRRIAACKTGEAGRFCFVGLPSGKYELRCSIQGGGWDVTHVYVRIAPGCRKDGKTELKVQMYLGD